MSRFDVFVMPLWRAPGDLPLTTQKLYHFFTKKKILMVKFLLAFHSGRPESFHRLPQADHFTGFYRILPQTGFFMRG
jgi:hypothetical protein